MPKLRAEHAVGIVDGQGALVGGVALSLLSPFDGALSIHLARRNAMTPRILREMFTWAFREQGLVRLTCHVAKGNRRARRLVEGLGFKLEGLKRRGYDGRFDACLYGLCADQCRWLMD